MVESIDGRATIGGRVGALTGPVDQRIVYALRAQADALLVGAGTVRNERYGGLFPDVPAGADQPLVVIVSGRLDLPADLPLLGEPDARVVIATPSDGDAGLRSRRVGRLPPRSRLWPAGPTAGRILRGAARATTACGRSSARAGRALNEALTGGRRSSTSCSCRCRR